LENNSRQIGIQVIAPVPLVSKSGEEIISWNSKSGQKLFVRILSYVPGQLLADVELNAELCYKFGQLLGKVDRIFQDFNHPAAHRYMAWDLANAKKVVLAHLPAVQEPNRIAVIHYFISLYESQVEPVLPTIRKSIIHGDPNDRNILVVSCPDNLDSNMTPSTTRNVDIGGLLDFGDLVHSHSVNEISVAVAYAMLGKSNPIAIAKEMIAGYHKEFPLHPEELRIIFLLSCMRLCTSAVMGVYNITLQPENREYLEVHSKPAWQLLEEMKHVNIEEVVSIFERALER